MWINSDRCLYAGFLGKPSQRSLGAFAIYASLEAPFRISVDGGEWQSSDLVVVPPYQPHRVASSANLIALVMIEPETIAAEHRFETAALLQRIRAAYRCGAVDRDTPSVLSSAFDTVLFGEPLPARALVPRVATVIEVIKRTPHAAISGEQCAASVHLSFSRFLHLFKQETGVAFRIYRSWRRARNLLQYVTHEASLTQVALDTGYPDATHFSHSIRRIYGLKPSDIFAGSRRAASDRSSCGLRVVSPRKPHTASQ